MAHRYFALTTLGCSLAATLALTAAAGSQDAVRGPLTLASGRVTIAGTSNIHEYTASTNAVRVTRLALANGIAGPALLQRVLEPGAVEAFEIAVSAGSLSSPKDGLDKNMHKALKVQAHPDITFKLSRLEAAAPGAFKAIGQLGIAGVEREVALDLKVVRSDAGLAVSGTVTLLMTDYGITPPKAMLGMLKTDPKVTVTFETVLALPLT